MLNFLKRNKKPSEGDTPSESVTENTNLFSRLKQSLGKTRAQLSNGLANLFLGKKTLDSDVLEQLETVLLLADVGVEATQEIIDQLTQQLKRKELTDSQAALQALQQHMLDMLLPVQQPLQITGAQPFLILMVGINGAGKTTSIGKLAKLFQQQGKKMMLAAGDTFRAAAIEQLQVWGERNDIPVIAQQSGADTASVIFDAFESAKAKKMDVLIADTAGRLHTQDNLMAELKKIDRVIKKLDPQAPHETLLVLDASIGQNALNQATQFHQAIGVTGIVLTKLDGSAKGGILFAIAKQLNIPIRFIGIGEGIDDLRPFNAAEFVQALLGDEPVILSPIGLK